MVDFFYSLFLNCIIHATQGIFPGAWPFDLLLVLNLKRLRLRLFSMRTTGTKRSSVDVWRDLHTSILILASVRFRSVPFRPPPPSLARTKYVWLANGTEHEWLAGSTEHAQLATSY